MSERYDEFTVGLFRDDAGDWVAHFNELPEISAFGHSPEAALQEPTQLGGRRTKCTDEEGTPIPRAPAKKEYHPRAIQRADWASLCIARWQSRQLRRA